MYFARVNTHIADTVYHVLHIDSRLEE